MNRLIKNEIKKLFSKKVMYILFIITIAATILTNVLYSIEYSSEEEKEFLKDELSYIKEDLKSDEYKLAENKDMYIDLQTQYEQIKLQLNYETDSWQYYFIEQDGSVYNAIRAIKESEYNKNEKELKKAQEEYDKLKERLDSGDWKSFVQEQLKEAKEDVAVGEKEIVKIKDKKKLEEATNELEYSKANQQTLEWRLEKDIPYGNSFLSNQIDIYLNGLQTVNTLKNTENKTQEEKQEYEDSLKQMNVSQYYIENNINIENEYNAGYVLANLMTEYGIFIIIFGIIVAGTIVSNEAQKGTIKLLLTRPYSRSKILLSKYIVAIAVIFIFIIGFAFSQFIVGGIIQGFDGFNIPMVEYNLNTNSIVTMNVVQYLLLQVVGSLPIPMLLSTLAFALSTITTNSAVSVAIPILGYMMSEVINVFIEKIKILKYFVTANWDLSLYLFGGKGLAEGLNWYVSLIICCIYLAIMIVTAFIVFKKRDIKNV